MASGGRKHIHTVTSDDVISGARVPKRQVPLCEAAFARSRPIWPPTLSRALGERERESEAAAFSVAWSEGERARDGVASMCRLAVSTTLQSIRGIAVRRLRSHLRVCAQHALKEPSWRAALCRSWNECTHTNADSMQ